MIKCCCGGNIAELGEMDDYNNPCICKDLKIEELKKQNEELIKFIGYLSFQYRQGSTIQREIKERLEKIKQKPIEEILKGVMSKYKYKGRVKK